MAAGRWRRMRLNPTIAAIAAGIFALLVVIYVFAGGRNQKANPDRLSETQISGGAKRQGPTPCWSQGTADGIKNELFRRAALERGSDAEIFQNIAAGSSARVTNPRALNQDQAGAATGCVALVALSLPQGLSVVGGNQALSGEVSYAVQPNAGGGGSTLIVTGGDAIIVPLATLSRTGPDADDRQTAAVDGEPDATPAIPPAAAPRPQPAPRVAETRPQPAPRQTEPRVQQPPRRADVKPAPPRPRAAPTRTAEVAPRSPIVRPGPIVRPKPVVADPVRTTSPSFNCRNARTRGEIAVCRNDDLAGLDRQMAAQFNRAVAAANRGKKTQLERSRTQFLRYRDSCPSQGCIAGAYRDRMQEIDDIMNERWSPR